MRFRTAEHATNEALIQYLWPEFDALVPNDEVGLEIVFRALSALGLIRCKCGSQAVVREENSRTFTCSDCRAKVWFTAGTMFFRVKHFKAWLGSIWLMESGVVVASSRLAQLASIAQATAHNIQKKIRLLIEDCFDLEAPSVSAALFSSIMTKRSKSSLPNAHPNEELSDLHRERQASDHSSRGDFDYRDSADTNLANADCQNSDLPGSNESPVDLEENERKVFDCISYVPISFDSLCVLTGLSVGVVSSAIVMLELSNRIICLDGDFFVRSKPVQSSVKSYEIHTESAQTLLAAANRLIRSIHHGVSFKWLQSFLAMIWFFFDKIRWPKGSLLVAFLRSGPIEAERASNLNPSRLVVFPSVLSTVAN